MDPCSVVTAECQDGVVTHAETPGLSCPELSPPREIGRCEGDCTTDYRNGCPVGSCTVAVMCADPPAAPLPPPLDCSDVPSEPCVDGDIFACGGSVGSCGVQLRVGTCRCEAGGWSCQQACADGLCGAAAVQRALAGTWTGTVTSPWDTYEVTLTFSDDGHYYSIRPGFGSVFYYGVDGGGDARRFHVLGQTRLGATALVRVNFGGGTEDGLARGIRIEGDRLSFDFVDGWLSCADTFRFELTRVSGTRASR